MQIRHPKVALFVLAAFHVLAGTILRHPNVSDSALLIVLYFGLVIAQKSLL